MPVRVLLVEDSEVDARLIEAALERAGLDFESRRVDTAAALRQALDEPWDAVCCDYDLPALASAEVFRSVKEHDSYLPFILISDALGEEQAVALVKAGMDDYVMKDNLTRLPVAIRQEMQRALAKREYDRAQQALIESENRYRRVIETATEGTVLIDKDGRFREVSARFAQMLGRDPEEMVGRPLTDFLMAEDHEDYRRRDKELKNGRALRFERRFVGKDGLVRWVGVSTAPLIAADGSFTASLSMMMDITERKNMEKALQLTQLSVDRATDLIHWVDSEGRVLFVNDATCRRHGYGRDEMLAMTVFDLDPNITREVWDVRLQNMRKEGSSAFEVEHVTKSGEVFPLEMVVNYVEYGGKEYVISFGRDISARKEAERALREREEQLRQVHKMEAVGQLAGGIAHDFNNLLMPIIGNASLLLAEMPVDHPDTELLRDIKEAGERAAALTKQMLAFSRSQKMESRAVQLNDIITGVEPLLRGVLGEDVDVVFHLDQHLRQVGADRHQVEQVLVNLAVNAKDAMPSGGSLVVETANVVLDEAYCSTNPELKPGPYAMLAVSDSGCGMDGSTLERAFDPFFTTKDVGKGTGLGLSTVFGVVRQSGGGISVQSQPGHGTCFRIYLPVVTAAEAAPEGLEQGIARTAPATILLLEDESAVRHLIGRVLRGAGYDVVEAGSVAELEEALPKAGKTADLLLTDVVLPGGRSGRDAAAAMRRRFPGIRVLYMSGYTGDSTEDPLFEEGAELLEKPFPPIALLERVGAALRDSGIS